MSQVPKPEREPDLALEGRYELLELLSEGGMGSIWRGRHRTLDRPVAIKLMRASLRDNPEMRDRFSVEARVASALSHPNVVSVTDFGFDRQRGYFLVMELLFGDSLRDRMSHGALKARVACDVVEQVGWALRYIHSRGIIHCDLKPENIFLAQLDEESRRRNHVKLIDFGLAFRTTGMTSSLAGTPPYLAPERLCGDPPSPAADLYSLGAVFYEMLTGRVPYDGTVGDLVEQHRRGKKPIPPSRLCSEPLEPRTDDVILRALAQRPEDRHPSVESFLFDLRTLMSMMGMRVRRVTRSVHGQVRRLPAAPTGPRRSTPRRVRMHERVPLVLPVIVRRDSKIVLNAMTENLSEGGAFINLNEPLPLGTELELSLPLREQPAPPVVVRAVVRWQRVVSNENGKSGCGLQWLNPTDSQRIALGQALRSAD